MHTNAYIFAKSASPFPSEAGFSFGELALINRNCIRNASIITDETTDLLVVNRELYNRCLKAAQSAELEEKYVNSGCILFSNISYILC